MHVQFQFLELSELRDRHGKFGLNMRGLGEDVILMKSEDGVTHLQL